MGMHSPRTGQPSITSNRVSVSVSLVGAWSAPGRKARVPHPHNTTARHRRRVKRRGSQVGPGATARVPLPARSASMQPRARAQRGALVARQQRRRRRRRRRRKGGASWRGCDLHALMPALSRRMTASSMCLIRMRTSKKCTLQRKWHDAPPPGGPKRDGAHIWPAPQGGGHRAEWPRARATVAVAMLPALTCR
jgi:hypothetical protein